MSTAPVVLEEPPGGRPATADKLLDSGFDSGQSIAVARPAELSNSAVVGESEAPKVIQEVPEEAEVDGFESGATILE